MTWTGGYTGKEEKKKSMWVSSDELSCCKFILLLWAHKIYVVSLMGQGGLGMGVVCDSSQGILTQSIPFVNARQIMR
jgi:hypothetical protein